MKDILEIRYLATKRAVFTETSQGCLKRKPGQPKPLRPQAIRLLKELNSRRLRHHYMTGQVCMVATLVIWLVVPFLPNSAQSLEMSALRLCLYIVALVTLTAGLSQAWFICRAKVRIGEI